MAFLRALFAIFPLLAGSLLAGEIHEAAARGDIPLLTALASRGPAARASTDAGGLTALHHAVIHRQAEAVAVLLAAGAPVDARDRDGNTPLHHIAHSVEESVVENFKAAASGAFGEALGGLTKSGQPVTPATLLGLLRTDLMAVDEPLKLMRNFAAATTAEQLELEVKCARALVKAGADVDAMNRERATPLHNAAMSPWPDLVAVLTAAGAKVDGQNAAGLTPLHHAALFGSPATVEYLLKMGADPEGRSVLLGVAPLVMAVTRGERRAVSVMLEHHADVNVLGPGGETPLARASMLGATEVAALLIEKGARVNVRFARINQTPLHAAAMRGFLPLMQLLLEHGAEVDAKDGAGFTPLILAGERGQTLAIRILLNAGAAVDATNGAGRSALWLAASRGHAESAAFLMNHGASRAIAATDGQTPLHIAAFNGRPAALRVLLERQPDLKAMSRIGTPLHAAAAGPTMRAFFASLAKPGQKPTPAGSAGEAADCARLLIEAGAPLDAEDANGATPAQAAAAFGNKAVLQLIGAKSRNALRARDRHGLAPLHHAARGPAIPGYPPDAQPLLSPELLAGCAETVAALVAAGAEINGPDNAGLGPLHHAASAGNLPALKALLAAKANVRLAEKSGATPLHWAAARGRTEAAVALLAAHAPPNAVDGEGQTPLHMAIAAGHGETARALLQGGADPNAVNRRGQSALAYAESYNRPDIARTLRESGAKRVEIAP